MENNIQEDRQWFRDISNYCTINNDIRRRDRDKPQILNSTPVSKTVFTSKFGFSQQDYIDLPELDGEVCIPGHHDMYRSVIGTKWNNYCEVNWSPSEGEWPTIEKLIKHLYGKNSVEDLDQVEELYDYHTKMMLDPTAPLHARILYSHAQGTSKSALAELENIMFGDNYSKIRDNEFESSFNGIWVNSLILHLDEPSFKDKVKMSRVLRDIVTSNSINLRKMHTDYTKVDFFAKLLVTTNDSDWMPIEAGDRRYWVREVPKFKQEDADNNFNNKMKSEVNHYLYFLLNRELKYKEKQGVTFWLPDNVIDTNGFAKVVVDNKSDVEKEIIEVITQAFIKSEEAQTLHFRIKDILFEIAVGLGVKEKDIDNIKIVQALRDGLKIEQPQKNIRPKKNELSLAMDIIKPVGKYWVAKREDFDCTFDVFEDVGVR